MTSFVCDNCGYRFEAVKKKSCPYCDRETVEKEKTAEELLNDISEG